MGGEGAGAAAAVVGGAGGAQPAMAEPVRRASPEDVRVVRARVVELLESRLREFCALNLAKWGAQVPADHPFMGWDAGAERLVVAPLSAGD